jgi:hypothetical protein
MMGGIVSQPPGDSGGLPTIPIPDFTQQGQAEAAGYQAAGWFQDFMLAFWAAVFPGLQTVVGLIVRGMEWLCTMGYQLLQAAQGANSPQFFQLCAAVVSDLLGFEVGTVMSQSNMTIGGSLGPFFQVGKQFLDAITGEMNPNNQSGPAAGYAAATQWLGRAIGFAIREGNVENFIQLLPQELRFFEGLRGYGVNMAQALGLGRLTHEALRGYMKTMVSDPLTYYLNDKLHPAMLARNEIIQAWRRGAITDEVSAQWLSWLGYSADLTAFIRDITKWLPSDSTIISGWRIGEISATDFNTLLVERDVDSQDLEKYIPYFTFARCEAHLNSAIANYITLLKNRWITEAQFRDQLSGLGVDDLEIKWAEQEVFPLLNYQTKELDETQIEDAFAAGLIDQDYYTDWMTRWGYSPSDQAVMMGLFLIKQQQLTEKADIAAWNLRVKCLKAKTAGEPLPPGFNPDCTPS